MKNRNVIAVIFVVGLALFMGLTSCGFSNQSSEVYSELSLDDRLLVDSYADCVNSRIPRTTRSRAVTWGPAVALALHEGRLTREDMAVFYRNLGCGEISTKVREE